MQCIVVNIPGVNGELISILGEITASHTQSHCKRHKVDMKNPLEYSLVHKYSLVQLSINACVSVSPVKYWLLASVKSILQLSDVIGLSRGSEESLLLESVVPNEADTLFDQQWDLSLSATLGLVRHRLLKVLPKDPCRYPAQKNDIIIVEFSLYNL